MDKFKEMMRLFSDPYHYWRRVSLMDHLFVFNNSPDFEISLKSLIYAICELLDIVKNIRTPEGSKISYGFKIITFNDLLCRKSKFDRIGMPFVDDSARMLKYADKIKLEDNRKCKKPKSVLELLTTAAEDIDWRYRESTNDISVRNFMVFLTNEFFETDKLFEKKLNKKYIKRYFELSEYVDEKLDTADIMAFLASPDNQLFRFVSKTTKRFKFYNSKISILRKYIFDLEFILFLHRYKKKKIIRKKKK